MGEETYKINWDTFGAHLSETAKRLYETKVSADVTLISDDLNSEYNTIQYIELMEITIRGYEGENFFTDKRIV